MAMLSQQSEPMDAQVPPSRWQEPKRFYIDRELGCRNLFG